MNEAVWYVLGSCAAAIAVVMIGVWLLSLYLRDVSIIDIAWGSGFVVVAWTAYLLPTVGSNHLLIPVLTTIWGLRLSAYLAWRNHGRPEDYRYQAMRRKWGRKFPWVSLVTVFGVQAAVMWVVSLPVQTAHLGDSPQLQWLLATGVILWAIGLFFESIGDWQLARFKSDSANDGKVLDTGLWRYTRHPNYFGDFLVWWGLFFASTASSQLWWTVIGPITMSVFLMRISGVTLLEQALHKNKHGYADYVEQTNAFFPGIPANQKSDA